MSSWTGCTSISDANTWNCSTNMSFETALGDRTEAALGDRLEGSRGHDGDTAVDDLRRTRRGLGGVEGGCPEEGRGPSAAQADGQRRSSSRHGGSNRGPARADEA